jgi:hypothetical protein
VWDRDGRQMPVICGNGQANYFLRQDWTGSISLNDLQKFAFTRSKHSPHQLQRHAGIGAQTRNHPAEQIPQFFPDIASLIRATHGFRRLNALRPGFVIASDSDAIQNRKKELEVVKKNWIASSHSLLAMTARQS